MHWVYLEWKDPHVMAAQINFFISHSSHPPRLGVQCTTIWMPCVSRILTTVRAKKANAKKERKFYACTLDFFVNNQRYGHQCCRSFFSNAFLCFWFRVTLWFCFDCIILSVCSTRRVRQHTVYMCVVYMDFIRSYIYTDYVHISVYMLVLYIIEITQAGKKHIMQQKYNFEWIIIKRIRNENLSFSRGCLLLHLIKNAIHTAPPYRHVYAIRQ